MRWQDVVLMAAFGLANLSLIPTIRSKSKPALATSGAMALLTGIVTVTFATLGLWLSVAGNAIGFAGWSIIAVQTWRATKRSAAGQNAA